MGEWRGGRAPPPPELLVGPGEVGAALAPAALAWGEAEGAWGGGGGGGEGEGEG